MEAPWTAGSVPAARTAGSSSIAPLARSAGSVSSAPPTRTEGSVAVVDIKRLQVAKSAAKAKSRLALLDVDIKIQGEMTFWRFAEDQVRGVINSFLVDRIFEFFDRNKSIALSISNIWLATLRAIEGKFGSAIMITFGFLRFVFLLNLLLSLLWMCIIVFPFFAKPPISFSWNLLHRNSDPHKLGSTWIFYGGYNYTTGEQTGWYRTDYVYTLVVGAMMLATLALVLYRMTSHILGSGDVTNTYRSTVYPFSTVIFAGWDFHLTKEESSSNLRRGIRMRLRETLSDHAEHHKEMYEDTTKKYKRNFALFFLFPILMTGTVMAVVGLVSKQAEIDKYLHFMKGFAQPLLLAAVNISSPRLVRFLVFMEDWKPATADQVLLVKLYFMRMLNVGTLFYRLYVVLEHARTAKEGTNIKKCGKNGECTDGLLCCMENDAYLNVWPTCKPSKIGLCVADCADNAIAKLLLQLIVSSTVIDNAAEAFNALFSVYWLKKRMQMEIVDMPIRVVYVQAVVWVGSMFSPIAAVAGAISNGISFVCMKEVLMRACAPMEKAYSASSTANITYGLLLITLVFASIPIVFRLTSPSSGICGPVKEGISSYQVINNYIEKAPTAIWVTYEWLSNPMVMGGVILLLIFAAVLLRAKITQISQSVELTARELSAHQNEGRGRLALARIQNRPSYRASYHAV